MVSGTDWLSQRCHDPEWLVPRMGIVDKRGRSTNLRRLKPGQRAIVRAVLQSRRRRTFILKPRQIGSTTIVTACLVWLATFSPEQYGVITVAHDEIAMGRINDMTRGFIQSMPKVLGIQFERDSAKHIKLKGGARFVQGMAGGRNAGRSFTFQAYHATEMGLWPKGSSAHRKDDTSLSVDRDVHASVLSTLDMSNPRSRMVIESTANGPLGVYYDLARVSRTSEHWNFLFFPWWHYPEYEVKPPKGFELRPEEARLAEDHFPFWDPERPTAASYRRVLRKMAWRRMKIEDEQYGLTRFRREFPLTWEEPFLISAKMWIDTELLNTMLAGVPTHYINDKATYRAFLPYEPHRRYFMGVDPAGGTGGDGSVFVTVRDDGEIAATWSSNSIAPRAFAEEVGRFASVWSTPEARCRVLCELNNHGKAVLEVLRGLGVMLWKTPEGKDWWSTRASKFRAYAWARDMVEGGFVSIVDPNVIGELMRIREQRNGNIEADEGYHDDHADAWALALYNARESITLTPDDYTLLRIRAKKRALRERGLR